MRRTKIVCTLGPSSASKSVIKQMILAGMNVARFNMSHGTHESHHQLISLLKEAREELNKPVAIMIDTRGPEIRIRQFQNGFVNIKKGDRFILTTRNVIGNEQGVSVTLASFNKVVKKGDIILLNDGLIKFEVEGVQGTEVLCKILVGGRLSNNKSINIPGVDLNLNYLSDGDKKDILFGIEEGADIFSASFVGCASDVLEFKKFLKKNGYEKEALVIAKIESRKGVSNMDEIIAVADGVMVARGDLGVEVEFEKIPYIQKQLISRCVGAGKMVITATEMLESMIHNVRPTRAEISDIANAVLDGTSAVMLSGETSAGEYPVLSVETMAKIALECERTINYDEIHNFGYNNNVSASIGYAACELSKALHAKAIVVATASGFSARSASRCRPSCEIVACTPNVKTYYQLSLSWGVTPVMDKTYSDTDSLIAGAKQKAHEHKIVKKGDLIVQMASTTAGGVGSNMILVDMV